VLASKSMASELDEARLWPPTQQTDTNTNPTRNQTDTTGPDAHDASHNLPCLGGYHRKPHKAIVPPAQSHHPLRVDQMVPNKTHTHATEPS